MALLVLAFLGGILTVFSPCILPILPFVFSKADRPFRKSGLPLLSRHGLDVCRARNPGDRRRRLDRAGQSVRPHRGNRGSGDLRTNAAFGSLATWLSRPLVRMGSRIASAERGGDRPDTGRSLLLGVATGLLWAPCAGPILGLILTGAAVGGASGRTAFLLLAYATGAAISLAIALLAGRSLFGALKKSLTAEVWIRRVLGVAVLAGVAVIAFGFDRGLLTQLSLASTSGVEQSLVDRLQPKKEAPAMMMMMSSSAPGKSTGPSTLPDLSSAHPWINSQPLSDESLRGHVVLVDFLDLLLHQLSTDSALYPRLGGYI